MHVHQRLDDREPEAQAAGMAIERLLALHEQIEHMAQQLGRDAAALVFDDDLHQAIAFAQAQRDAAVGRRELGGVAEQVAQHLRQAHRVADDPQRLARQVDLDRARTLFERRLRELERTRDDCVHVDALVLQRDLALGDA